jgi:PIN domain nuclease of toxin-antitoxin system
MIAPTTAWSTKTRYIELSLADRLCLALGLRLDIPVATADAAWSEVAARPRVLLIR